MTVNCIRWWGSDSRDLWSMESLLCCHNTRILSNVAYPYADAWRIITTTQQRRATQFLRKIYLSLYWKGCVWEGVGDRTELQHIDPHSIGHNHVSFPSSWAAQPGAWGPSLSRTCSSIQHLLSNWLNFLCTDLYNSSTLTFFLWASQIALIQPVHGQGYILIFLDRMHLLFTQVHFLFWQSVRVEGQYTT